MSKYPYVLDIVLSFANPIRNRRFFFFSSRPLCARVVVIIDDHTFFWYRCKPTRADDAGCTFQKCSIVKMTLG